MNTTQGKSSKRHLLLSTFASLLVSLIMLATLGQQAKAVETYRAGLDVGTHADATAICRGWPYMTITVRPRMGTTPGWEFGQTVAFRIYILDANKRAVGWLGTKDSWVTTRIATKRWKAVGDAGAYALETDPWGISTDLSPYTWQVQAGFYTVRVDYAWLTGRGWSYATNVTSYYDNELSGTFGQTADRTCGISPY